jgi:hypothetical protein
VNPDAMLLMERYPLGNEPDFRLRQGRDHRIALCAAFEETETDSSVSAGLAVSSGSIDRIVPSLRGEGQVAANARRVRSPLVAFPRWAEVYLALNILLA